MKSKISLKGFTRKLKYFFLFFIFMIYSTLHSQIINPIPNNPNYFCGTMSSVSDSTKFSFFPMDGDTLRALVVFCNFAADSGGSYDIPGSVLLNYWPGSQAETKPSWADSIICPTTTNIWNRSLTGLFKGASLGHFYLIGDVYHNLYIFKHSVSYYSNSSRGIGYAVKELLESIDTNINFANYDKFDPFDYNRNGNRREPDGIVDFIFINFRFNLSGTLDPPTYTGIDDLGGRHQNFGEGVTEITLDGKRILSQSPGSGAIYEMSNPWAIGIPAHEFGEHYSFGSGHSDTMGAYNINGGGLASAYDRRRLNWSPGAEMNSSYNTTFTLRDYFTTGDYVKIVRQEDTIYFENRERRNYNTSLDFRRWNGFPGRLNILLCQIQDY